MELGASSADKGACGSSRSSSSILLQTTCYVHILYEDHPGPTWFCAMISAAVSFPGLALPLPPLPPLPPRPPPPLLQLPDVCAGFWNSLASKLWAYLQLKQGGTAEQR